MYFYVPNPFKHVAQLLINTLEMDIISVQITECDETSFLLDKTARIYDTGLMPAGISSMLLSMYSGISGHPFARVLLPTVTAKPSGVICKVKDQRVQTVDYEAFHIFNRNLVLQRELPITVKGKSTLTILGRICTSIKYENGRFSRAPTEYTTYLSKFARSHSHNH